MSAYELVDKKKYTDALNTINQVINKNECPDNQFYHYLLRGNIRTFMKPTIDLNKHLAVDDYTAAIGLMSKDSDSDERALLYAYLMRALAFSGLKKYDEAITDLTIVVNGVQDKAYHDVAYFNRSVINSFAGRNEDALEDLQQCQAAKENLFISHVSKYSILERSSEVNRDLGRPTDAIFAINSAIKLLESEDNIQAYPIGNKSKIEPKKYKSKRNASKYSDCYFIRAQCKFDLEDYRGAIQDYLSCLKFNPDETNCYFNIAASYYNLGDFKASIRYYTQCILKDPTYAEAYFRRGKSRLKIGEKNSGCLDLSKAGELGFTDAYAVIKSDCGR